jgi:hypothetical protein
LFILEVRLADLSFTTAPDREDTYKVGDRVEVYCDHEDDKGNRVRGWLEGVVVQVDPKIVAVQFAEPVYLTDGWMVPDHVLWCPPNSQQIRMARKRTRKPRAAKRTTRRK